MGSLAARWRGGLELGENVTWTQQSAAEQEVLVVKLEAARMSISGAMSCIKKKLPAGGENINGWEIKQSQ